MINLLPYKFVLVALLITKLELNYRLLENCGLAYSRSIKDNSAATNVMFLGF